MINNRYHVLRTIGRGGMAEVILAEDTQASRDEKNRQVAIKTYAISGEAESDMELFEREFTMLSSLTHPHINSVFDYGYLPEKKCFFFSAPYVDGTTLDEFAKVACFEEVLIVTTQVLEALDYLHIKGILHFDIKPANILVTRDPSTSRPCAKLLDMGISVLEKDRKHQGGFGTPNYMAPEVILGRDFDHRADLFSLGATLFKVIYGRPAFPGCNVDEVFPKVLSLDPEFPNSQKFPAPYIVVAQKLLNKHPDERFFSSSEILDYLYSAFPQVLTDARADHGRRLTRSTSLIGRSLELKYLLSGPIAYVTTDMDISLREKNAVLINQGLAHNLPTCVSVIGPEGVGKSRLLKEAKVLAQTALANTLVIDGRQPLDVLRVLDDIQKSLHSNTADWDDFVTTNLRTGDHSMLFSLKDKIFNYAGQVIQKTRVSNLLIIIDNFDGLSDLTRELISHLIGLSNFFLEESRFRLSVITGSRSERLENSQILELQNFASPELTEEYLCESLSLEAVPAWLVNEVHSISKGNPRFIEELTASLLESQTIRIEKGFISFDGESIPKELIPREIEDSYKSRLEGIPGYARKVLELVSLFENPAPFNIIAELFTLERIEILEGIQLLLERHFIVFDPRSKVISVENAVLRKVVHEGIDPEFLRLAHKKLFDYFMTHNFDKDEASLSEVARQAKGAGEDHQAFVLYAKLGQVHFSHLRLKKAIEAFEIALNIPGESSENSRFDLKIQIMQNLVSCYWTSGERKKAIRLLNNLSKLPLELPSKQAEILLLLAELHKDQGDFERARVSLNQYQHFFADLPECSHFRIRFAHIQALVLSIHHDYEQAILTLKDALAAEATKSNGNPNDCFQAYSLLGQLLDLRERTEEALEWYAKASQLSERAAIGIIDQCKLLSRLGSLHMKRMNAMEKAEQAFTAALEKAKRSFLPQASTILNLNIAIMYQDFGKLDKALEHYAIARRQAKSLGLKPQIAYVSLNLGILHYFFGLIKSAGDLLAAAYELSEATGNAILRNTVITAMADYFVVCKQYGEAATWARRGLQTLTVGASSSERLEHYTRRLTTAVHNEEFAEIPQLIDQVVPLLSSIKNTFFYAEALVCIAQAKSALNPKSQEPLVIFDQAIELLCRDQDRRKVVFKHELLYRAAKNAATLALKTASDKKKGYSELAQKTLDLLLSEVPASYHETFLKIRLSPQETQQQLSTSKRA